MADAPHSNRPLPGWLALAIMIGTAVLAIYWDHTYSGPYRWLAELQLRWLGQYWKTMTFLLAVMILLAPFGALLGVYKLVTRGRRATSTTI